MDLRKNIKLWEPTLDHSKISSIIARLTRKQPSDVQNHLSLGTLGLSSSFGLSALRSLLEKDTGLRLSSLNVNMTVSELINMVASGDSAVTISDISKPSDRPVIKPQIHIASNHVQSSPISPNFMGIGMDMQNINALPETVDFRAHTFYQSHFSAEELATAVLRPDPRAHLCGIFCAKEAAKKSHSELLNLRMDKIRVSHDPEGRPLLYVNDDSIPSGRFKFQISITHTEQVAAATCLCFQVFN